MRPPPDPPLSPSLNPHTEHARYVYDLQDSDQTDEEDHEDEAAPAVPADEDERPTNRPRTENYVAPDAKLPPGPFGWFLELPPVKSFLDGFRERFGGGKTPAAGADTEGTSQESAAKAEN